MVKDSITFSLPLNRNYFMISLLNFDQKNKRCVYQTDDRLLFPLSFEYLQIVAKGDFPFSSQSYLQTLCTRFY